MKWLNRLLLLTIALYFLSSGTAFAADDVLLENKTISAGESETYFGIDSITARNFIIESGGEAIFRVCPGGEINMEDGFDAQTGSKFETEISTASFAYWDGGGADNNWSTSANWGGDTVPSSTDIVYFGSNSDKNCNVDSNITIAGLIIQPGYDGTIAFNDKTITITGDFIKKDGTLNAGTSKVILAGTGGSGNQKVEFNPSQTLYNIEITNITGGTVVFNTGFTISNEFKINPGNYLKFMAGETFAINTLTGSGTDADSVYLLSTSVYDTWNLNLTNSATLSYLVVARCNASGGAYLAAGNSVDLGGNSNTILHSVVITSVLNRYHAKGSPTDATINYTIDGSDGFVADTVKLTIKDKGGVGVYNETEVGDKPIGSYNIKWPANDMNTNPQATPNQSPFIATVEILKECKGISHDTVDEENKRIYIWDFVIDTEDPEYRNVIVANDPDAEAIISFDPKKSASTLYPWDGKAEIFDGETMIVDNTSSNVYLTPSTNIENASYVTWNGKDKNNNYVDAGTYTLHITLTKDSQSVEHTHSIYIIGVEIDEPIYVTRGQSGTITAVVTPSLTPDKVEWVFTGGKGGTKTTTPNLSTSVILVDGDNVYTVTCKVTIGSAVAEDSAIIRVNPRTGASWQITPTCATDNEPTWGDFPGSVYVGQERDRVSNTPRIVIPVNGGFTCAQVDDPNGPNDDYWYIQGTTLAIDQETVINKYTKSGTTPPTPPGTNWHEYNESQSVDADGCLDGIKGHEYKGVAGNEGQGHYAFLEDKEDDAGMDAKTAIEDNWHATSQSTLNSDTQNDINDINDDIETAAAVQPSGNWGPSTIYIYDFGASQWTTTTYGN